MGHATGCGKAERGPWAKPHRQPVGYNVQGKSNEDGTREVDPPDCDTLVDHSMKCNDQAVANDVALENAWAKWKVKVSEESGLEGWEDEVSPPDVDTGKASSPVTIVVLRIKHGPTTPPLPVLLVAPKTSTLLNATAATTVSSACRVLCSMSTQVVSMSTTPRSLLRRQARNLPTLCLATEAGLVPRTVPARRS